MSPKTFALRAGPPPAKAVADALVAQGNPRAIDIRRGAFGPSAIWARCRRRMTVRGGARQPGGRTITFFFPV